jgi:hypothetical protein
MAAGSGTGGGGGGGGGCWRLPTVSADQGQVLQPLGAAAHLRTVFPRARALTLAASPFRPQGSTSTAPAASAPTPSPAAPSRRAAARRATPCASTTMCASCGTRSLLVSGAQAARQGRVARLSGTRSPAVRGHAGRPLARRAGRPVARRAAGEAPRRRACTGRRDQGPVHRALFGVPPGRQRPHSMKEAATCCLGLRNRLLARWRALHLTRPARPHPFGTAI